MILFCIAAAEGGFVGWESVTSEPIVHQYDHQITHQRATQDREAYGAGRAAVGRTRRRDARERHSSLGRPAKVNPGRGEHAVR